MRTKYRVRVTYYAAPWFSWDASCDACRWALARGIDRGAALREATRHAARCEDLHWLNWAAACPSCKAYGRVAKACPVCLGYGYEREREGLE